MRKSELIVLAFKNETDALSMRDTLIRMQKMQLITLQDAAVVIRRQDGKTETKQVTSLTGAGALGGAFWGMLIGLLFWMPWLGLAIGAISGAVAGKFSDIGVDDKFIKEVGSKIEPGHSALFLLVRDAVMDKLAPELEKYDAEVIQTSLSNEAEANLRAMFGSDKSEEEVEAETA